MLTSDLIRPFLQPRGKWLTVDLLDETSLLWQRTAADLIQLIQEHVGRTRGAWEEALETYEGARIDYLRIRGLARVLANAAKFTQRPTSRLPLEVRAHMRAKGPAFAVPDMFHQLTRADVIREASTQLEMAPSEVDDGMFADLPQEHILTDAGPRWTPLGLLQRYNLELSRGALYRAIVVQIEVYDNFKDIWRYLKLFKIMYLTEEIASGGYRITLSGPLSDFVETERYGVFFAEFLPAVLLGERWNLLAKIKPYPIKQPNNQANGTRRQEPTSATAYYYRLDHTCGLHSYFRKGRLFDSGLERVFASEFTDFEEKFGEERGKWRLAREDQVLVLDGTVMIPDFALIHAQDERRRILVELVGYWSPRYLKAKIAKTKAVKCPYLLLLVYESLNVTKEDFAGAEGEILFFKEKPILKEVMRTVEDLASRVYGPLSRQEPRRLSLPELVQTCESGLAGDPGVSEGLSIAQLGALLKEKEPRFTPTAYGYKNMSSLVQGCPELFAVSRLPGKGRHLRVRLLGSGSEGTHGREDYP